MSRSKSILVAFVTTLLSSVCSGHMSAIASFNSRGITGTITFTEIPNSSNISIITSLQGLRGNHAWHVHTLPVDQTADPAYQCLSSVAGPHYDPFNANNDTNYQMRCTTSTPELCEVGDLAGKFGPIPAAGSLETTDTTGFLALRGRLSIVGRSVVIHNHLDGTNFECATIRFSDEQPGDVISLQARFISPIAGTVYFRQVGNRDVVMWGKFYWVNDVDTTLEHNWHIHQSAPGEEYRAGMCTTLGPHYDPLGMGPTNTTEYRVQCTSDTPEGCEIGDLTGKHDTLTISANPSPFAMNSFLYTDRNLSLADVVNRSVAIHVTNGGAPIVACAPLVASEDIILYSYENGIVNTNFRVSQISPFEDTAIMSNSQNVNVLGTALNPLTNCLAMGDVYSPFPPVDSSPDGELTPDRIVLGDFNQRYEFTGQTVSAFDVPIHSGNNTVSGKSVRFISGVNNRMCSALLPRLEDSEMIIAKASFNAEIGGAIYFIQQNFGSDQLGNTHIIVDIYHSSMTTTTTGHNWHVHQNLAPTVSGNDRGASCTADIGGHYNPFNVSLANTNDVMMPSQFSNYSDDCTVRYNLRCESGDLSGKHGRLTISPDNAGRPVVSFVDSNLALTGSYSIIDRSIGLHDPTGPLYDCGNITRMYISSSVVSVIVNAGESLRSEIVRMLSGKTMMDNASIDPTNVLVLSQSISPLGPGVNCVNVTARVLGSTQAEADQNAETLSAQAANFICSGSPATVARLSILLLVVCTLLGLTFY